MGGEVTRKSSKGEMAQKFVVGMIKGVDASGMLVAQRASDNAPVDTSNLATSIHHQSPQVVGAGTVITLVGTNVEYARAQEMGSGLYAEVGPQEKIPIEPVNAKALAFEWPGGPEDHSAYDPESGLFFFGRVMHPGVRAQPYLRPALKDSEEDIRLLILRAVKAELTR